MRLTVARTSIGRVPSRKSSSGKPVSSKEDPRRAVAGIDAGYETKRLRARERLCRKSPVPPFENRRDLEAARKERDYLLFVIDFN